MHCDDCPARNTPLVPPEPARVARTMLAVVGEGPDCNEIEQRRPFIGASGQMLMRGCRRSLGLERSDIHWTNATLCLPDDDTRQKAVKVCARRLRQELLAVAPSVIMPVGGWGLSSLLNGGRKRFLIQQWRGSVQTINLAQPLASTGKPLPPRTRKPRAASSLARRKAPQEPTDVAPAMTESPNLAVTNGSGGSVVALLTPTLHPAFVMRSPLWADLLEIDVERVARLLDRPYVAPDEDPQRKIIIVESPGDLAALESLSPDLIGFDVETVGLGPTRTSLICFALGDDTTTVVVPWSRDRAGHVPHWEHPKHIAARISREMRRRIILTHNGPFFDHIVGQRYGLEVDRWADTLLWSHALRPHEPKNLAHVVTRGLDVPPWKQQEDRGADLPRLLRYNARDVLFMVLRGQQLAAEMRAA